MNQNNKALLWCGAIGPPLFIVAFLIEGATRAGYNPLRYPVSSLSIGPEGWMQITNFIITGLLFILFSLGLKSFMKPYKTWAPLMIGLVGMGLVGAGFCVSDPVYGYPADKPMLLAQNSLSGHLHDFFSMFVFICLPVACFKLHRWFRTNGEKGLSNYATFSWIAMLVMFFLAGAAFKQTPGIKEIAGVFQRASIISGWLCIMVVAIYTLRVKPVGGIN